MIGTRRPPVNRPPWLGRPYKPAGQLAAKDSPVVRPRPVPGPGERVFCVYVDQDGATQKYRHGAHWIEVAAATLAQAKRRALAQWRGK